MNIETLKFHDIDILQHGRIYGAEHEEGECDTIAVCQVTLIDDKCNTVSFFASYSALNHDDMLATTKISYKVDRNDYPDVLVNGLPVHNKYAIGEWRLHLDLNNACRWQLIGSMMLLRRSVDEIKDFAEA